EDLARVPDHQPARHEERRDGQHRGHTAAEVSVSVRSVLGVTLCHSCTLAARIMSSFRGRSVAVSEGPRGSGHGRTLAGIAKPWRGPDTQRERSDSLEPLRPGGLLEGA